MLQLRNAREPVSLFRFEMDRLFDDFLGGAPRRSVLRPAMAVRHAAFPAFNIWENEECYFVEAECPGLEIEDLDLSISGNELSVAGARKEGYPEGAAFHRQERGAGSFSRVLNLPSEIDADNISAELTNGVLTIQLPKAASAKPLKIAVRNS